MRYHIVKAIDKEEFAIVAEPNTEGATQLSTIVEKFSSYEKACIRLKEIDLVASESKNLSIYLPIRLINAIDICKDVGQSRSDYIKEALVYYITEKQASRIDGEL